MLRHKTTITRLDRDRLVEVTRSKATALRWAMFVDELRREIDRARVVEPARVSADVVTMHSKVRFLDLAGGKREVYTLVYPSEANPGDGRLSVLSPLGTALIGAREGDVLSVPSAEGPRRIRVESVLYQPEAAERRGHAAGAGSGRS